MSGRDEFRIGCVRVLQKRQHRQAIPFTELDSFCLIEHSTRSFDGGANDKFAHIDALQRSRLLRNPLMIWDEISSIDWLVVLSTGI